MTCQIALIGLTLLCQPIDDTIEGCAQKDPQFVVVTNNSARFVAVLALGDRESRNAHLTVFESQGDNKSLRKLYEAKLLNKWQPLIFCLSPDGRFFVTLNEWEGTGISPNSLVIYDLARAEHTAYSGKDFLTEQQIASLSKWGMPRGFIWHGSDCDFTLDSSKFIPTRLRNCMRRKLPYIVVDLATRTVEVEPKEQVDEQTLEELQDRSWCWKPSREFRDVGAARLPVSLTYVERNGENAGAVFQLSKDGDAYVPDKS
jgi:hypothetical protein